ncbi:MAG: hypothetical protein ABSE43_06325, partial [Steroidobacteraceae bacterium]
MTGRSAPASIAPTAVGSDSAGRDWFLRDSRWHDEVWVFTPTNALEHERPMQIRWSFSLPSGRCFTDASFAPLLEAARMLLSLIRTRSVSTGLPQRARTVVGHFEYLRELVRWMEAEGFSRFAQLDASALLRFQRAIEGRTN